MGTAGPAWRKVIAGALCLSALFAAVGTVGCATTAPTADPVVKKLDIAGNHALSDGVIEDKILTTKTGWWPFAQKYRFDPVVWTTDLERIKRLYGSYGYYQAEVVTAQATPDSPGGVDLKVELREGPVTRIGTIELQGLEAFAEARRGALLAKLPLIVGQTFEEKDWETA